MATNFKKLVNAFIELPLSTHILEELTLLLQLQTTDTLSSFISQTYESLSALNNKILQLLSEHCHDWSNDACFSEYLQRIILFNKTVIFHHENIEDNTKIVLFLPKQIDQYITVFEKIKKCADDNDPFIGLVSLWFENLSFFVHECPQVGHSPVIIHINEYITGHFILSNNFKLYLTQLLQTQLSPLIFTTKQHFYMKTCLLSLNVYFYSNPPSFNYSFDQLVSHMANNYLQLITLQTYAIKSWSKELLGCISHFIGFIRSFLWWDAEKGTKLKMFFSSEKNLCEHIEAMIRIVGYKHYYASIMSNWMNDETILMDSALLLLINIVQTQNINWFFRSMLQLPDILLQVAEASTYYRICLCAYGLLSEILTDEHLKQLKFQDNVRIFVLEMIEQAWHSPNKKYKQIPIIYFLRGN